MTNMSHAETFSYLRRIVGIDLAQDKDQARAVVNRVVNLPFP